MLIFLILSTKRLIIRAFFSVGNRIVAIMFIMYTKICFVYTYFMSHYSLVPIVALVTNKYYISNYTFEYTYNT